MKRIMIALMVAFTFCSITMAQKRTTISKDSTNKAKISATRTTDAKIADNSDSTYVADYTDEEDSAASNKAHSTSIIDSDYDDFPFGQTIGDTLNGGILISLIGVIAVFGMPILIVFIAFYFRYKNQKARYKLAEQALAAGQPLPEGFIKDIRVQDQRSQGIKNTFTGIGLFIFLWAITGKLGIGCIGLLVMFIGIGQWLIGINKENNNKNNGAAQ